MNNAVTGNSARELREVPLDLSSMSFSEVERAFAKQETQTVEQRALVQKAAEKVSQQLDSNTQITRVAMAQIRTQGSDIETNYQKIIEYIDRAYAEGAELVVFPELTIPGYMALDHFEDPAFIEANLEVLHRVVEYTRDMEMAVVVGYARPAEPENPVQKPYNSGAVVYRGNYQSFDKTLLPDYDIFWENRYFQPGAERKVIQLGGTRIGGHICEDIFDREYKEKPTRDLAQIGVDLFVNLSASPFWKDKLDLRRDAVAPAVSEHGVPYLYVNMVGTQDGYEGDVVFDGRSMFFGADGKLHEMGAGFEESLNVVDIAEPTAVEIPELSYLEEVHQALVMGIRDFYTRNGFSKAYIGISGGIDSALVAALAVEALGSENVIGVTMPSHITDKDRGGTFDDALRLAAKLGIRCDVRSIEKLYDSWLEDARRTHPDLESVTKQNIQARLRGQILMEYTNQDHDGLVLFPGNRTEIGLGYTTLYGDMVGALTPLADVNKLEVFALARLINDKTGREMIPESIIDRVPSAELEEGQTDAQSLGADFPVLAPLVDRMFDTRDSNEVLIKELNEMDSEFLRQNGVRSVEELVARVRRLFAASRYKRRQSPKGIKVKARTPGAGRRYPMARTTFS